MKRSLAGTVMFLTLVIAFEASAGDWPQFRYDSARTAASPEVLPAELHRQWVRELPAPRPAFPNEVRLRFDASYEPVVLGKTMFVPSMVTDSVTALDTETGAERWRFFADGPVRFAPVASKDKVYFISDDGYLYCVSAADGKLLWKFRGLPEDRPDRKLLGNGRLVSLRPARGGPVLNDGVIYFGAGIWLGEGIFLYALDAETGRVVWSNTDSDQIPETNLDHGVKSLSGLSPQGYFALLGEKLIVPCGAQLPGFLDRKTGERETYTMGWGGRIGLPKGTWLAAGVGKYLAHSGDLYDVTRPNDERFKDPRGRNNFKPLLYPGGYTRLQIDPTCQRQLGEFRDPVLTETVMYHDSREDGIAAYDLTQPEVQERAKTTPPPYRKNDQYPDKLKGTFPKLWSLASKLKVHIKAGPRLYVGGPGVVESIDIPGPGDQPKVSWRAEIDGTPHRMLAADGKLFLVTREGRIIAFAAKETNEPLVHAKPQPGDMRKADQWTSTAREILEETNTRDGYALVLGVGSGRLAEELVRQSDVFVIAVDPDAAKVAKLRQRYQREGLYGTRITVREGDPLTYPFPPFLAGLIVSEDLTGICRAFDQSFAKTVFHCLRPYGGTACLSIPAATKKSFAEELTKAKLAGSASRLTDDFLLLTRRGSLPGATDWSHDGADAACSDASQDEFLKPPLGLLWFDGSVRWLRGPGITMVRVAGGRVFIRADRLLAVDVFTGRHLWEAKLPSSSMSARADIVALQDGIYVNAGKTSLVLEPATGQQIGQIPVPAELAEKTSAGWSRIRVRDDYLIGSVGEYVVCVNRHDGTPLWSHRCLHNRHSLALGGGKVYCALLPKPKQKRKPSKPQPTPEKLQTLAFDLKTGEMLWEIPNASPLRYSEPHDLLLTTAGIYRGQDGTLLRKTGTLFSVAGSQMVSTTADNLVTYDLLTGDKTGKDLQWFRRGCTGLRAGMNLATTRYRGNAAYVDLATRQIERLWNVRSACNNNLIPANGVLNAPNLTGGCECNYTPASLALAPLSVIERAAGGK